MDDRTLLELAAKAVGMPSLHDANGIYGAWVGDSENGHWWNPLEDDGDALRLAVNLAIEISPCPATDSVMCEPKSNPDSIITVEALDDYGTRRAIVRAAAEIGKAMQEKY
ncbi:hypothetical protein [Pseudomonas fulva]|uniref:hypothetical protein n=1 Tax=Pseudomonas fulva TaxID=47880 RepID=UPI003D2F4BC4